MHLLVLVMMAAVIGHEAAPMQVTPAPPGLLAVAIPSPYLLLFVIAWWACRRGLKLLRAGRSARRTLRRLQRVEAGCRAAVVVVLVAQIYGLGWLQWLNGAMGGLIVLPELTALLLPMVTLVAMWSVYYPIDVHLRRSAVGWDAPAADTIGTRGQFVLAQTRHQILLIVTPLLAVLVWVRIVERWIAWRTPGEAVDQVLSYSGLVVIMLFTPLAMRVIWDTTPLPGGPMRERLLALCRTHGVRIRNLLLWRTYGGMINGAVMGFVGPLRYILLTDGLLQRMSVLEVEAVMAHEIGHVRRRHMPWLILCAIAILYATESLAYEAIGLADQLVGPQFSNWIHRYDRILGGVIITLVLGLWLVAFGWISRRFEQQADAFAVQHLSCAFPDDSAEPSPPVRISQSAIDAYNSALHHVSALNHYPLDKKSWRHGSLQWRMDHLQTLAGMPIHRCPIDRLVRRICIGCAVLLVASVLYSW